MKIAVLASGGGSNLQALIDADLGPGKIGLVIVNVPGAGAIDRARRAGIEVALVDHKKYSDRASFDRALLEKLQAQDVELVVLAGFMRLLTPVVLEAFPARVVNIHPSLLPAFPGVDAQKQAFDAGVRITGCTVHLVDTGMDTGPILAQMAVPILFGDSLLNVQKRILRREHKLFPLVVRAIAEGHLLRKADRFELTGMSASPDAALCSLAVTEG